MTQLRPTEFARLASEEYLNRVRKARKKMEYEWLEYELKNSPSLKLIRSDNVVFVVSFLVQQFKNKEKISIAKSELESSLDSYLEFLHNLGKNDYTQSASYYIKNWCDDQYLRLTYEKGSDDPILTLTPEIEKVISWLRDLEQKEFVGAESRFLQIVSLLKDVRDNTTTDPQERIRQLKTDAEKIQLEIEQIEKTGEIQSYNQQKLQEWFILSNNLSEKLISDFAQIAQNFRDLAKKVKEAQLDKSATKGAIIGHTLDEREILENSDQGRSFYAFFSYLMSSSQKQELKELIENVYTLDELKSLHQKYNQLKRLQSNLMKASDSIIKSNQDLAQNLRLVLDEKVIKENRRVAELTKEIQSLFLKNFDVLNLNSTTEEWLIWEGNPEFNLMMDRELHCLEEEQQAILNWENADLLELNESEKEELFNQFNLDEQELLQKINDCLESQSEISLVDLISFYPVTKGITEIVAYLSIATQDEKHLVTDTIENIIISSLNPEVELVLTLPQVIFRR